MSNRAFRRQMMREQTKKNQALVASYTKQQRIAGLIQNGITPEYLEKEYKRGVEDGVRDSGLQIVKSCYAGIILALNEEFGFGEDECFRAISACDRKVLFALDHQEMVDEILEKTGLTLVLDDPLERVQKT